MSVYDVLEERGFVQQVSHEEQLAAYLSGGDATAYVGFDITADSLHVGHMLPLMALAHLQRHGHRPVVVVGGGTTMIGDPSGKEEMRPILAPEVIEARKVRIKEQLTRFLDFGGGRALMVDNADWLLPLNYVSFLREVGAHFSVNRMLTAECFRSRLERGLSFIEFNYMLLQAYDFLTLYRRYGCRLQMGGDDQWSNMLAGADLIRRVEEAEAYVLTFPLLTTASGRKMGKTEAGAVWLAGDRTAPYDFYHYWRNVDDADAGRLLGLFTFLPMDEVRRLSALRGHEVNEAKKALALAATAILHGEEAAARARAAAEALFEGAGGGGDDDVPTTTVSRAALEAGLPLLDLLVLTGLASSKSEGRRLVNQGGLYLGDRRVDNAGAVLGPDDLMDDRLVFRKGRKQFHQVIVR
jgi:tyrosyl-tRNA synthetase